ncbi:hypothetical protein [Ottowia sp. VDI28]|uniref:hypothetical protein n=1 Tax=Ottowia sp. VDI28 TaxID=3133968 RepID=UPI003C2E5CB3
MKHLANTRTPDEYAALIDNARDFIDTEVIPRENLTSAHDGNEVRRVARELQALAQARGLGAPAAAAKMVAWHCHGQSAAPTWSKLAAAFSAPRR